MSLELDTLLHEVRALGIPEPYQSRLMALLGTFWGQKIYFARSVLVRPEQVRLARTMLHAGMPRAEIKRALIERLQVSEATAYRLIAQALEANQPSMQQVDMFR